MHIWRNYTTKQWSDWWACRKIDWVAHHLNSWNHPHRQMISEILKTFPWLSLIEIGCGAGANLYNIIMTHPKGKQLGGCDVNPDAIEVAQKTFKGAFLRVSPADDVLMSDNSADVVLTDMALCYIGGRKIKKAIHEIVRIARTRVILCEFNVPAFADRMKLLYKSGLHGHDYVKLLEDAGFYDVTVYKIPQYAWPDGDENHRNFASIIVAKVPKRKIIN